MAVHYDVDLIGLQDAQVGLGEGRGWGPEHDILQLGGDHGAAPAVGQAGSQALKDEVDRVVIHAYVGAVHDLHYLPIDAARIYAQLLPQLHPLGWRATGELDGALLLAELGHDGIGESDLAVHPVLLHQPLHLGLVLDLIAGGLACREQLEGMGHIPGMVGVGGGSGGDHAQEVTGHDDIRRGSADAFAGALSEGIYAAGAHVAVAAAQPQLSKAALRLLLLEAVPGRLQAGSLAYIEHLLAGRVYGSFTNILGHCNYLKWEYLW